MDKKQWKNISSIIGLTLIILTLFIYILGIGSFGKLPIYWTSLVLVLFSEIVFTYLLISLEKDILGISRIATSILYVGATSIVTACFIVFFPEGMTVFLLINGVILAITLVTYLLLGMARKYVNTSEKDMISATSTWESYEARVYTLLGNKQYEDYKGILTQLYEGLKYSDHSAVGNEATVVFSKIDELATVLKEQDKQSIISFINDLLKDIKAYNYKEKLSK